MGRIGRSQDLIVNAIWIAFLILPVGCTSFAKSSSEIDFSEQYRVYQGHARAGQAAITKADYIAAIDHYTEAIKMAPFEAAHYYYRGLAWYKKGNDKRALEEFDKVLILDERRHQAYLYRGLIRMNQEEYDGALKDYKQALDSNAEDPAVHNNLAWLYATAKDEKFRDTGKALEHARKAAELSREKNAQVLDTLAQAFFINGEFKKALEAQEEALTLDSENEVFREKVQTYEKALRGGE